MRVLVRIKRSPEQTYLIQLFTKTLIKRVRNLVSTKQHYKACMFALEHGIIVRKVSKDDLSEVCADLMLSETNARWDLTASK